jgi:putative ABC transport system permease protein
VERERPPTYYSLLVQNYESGVALHVRAAERPTALVPAIRDAVRQVDSQLALEPPQLLRDVLDRTLSTQRMLATLVGLFGAVALLLGALGLYGVMSHLATQRTPEIGMRLAMGAQPASIVGLLLTQGLRLLGIGAVIGLTGALVGTQYIEAQLFGVTATDPVTFVSGCVVLAIAGVTASVVPALRATRIDPIVALRRA